MLAYFFFTKAGNTLEDVLSKRQHIQIYTTPT